MNRPRGDGDSEMKNFMTRDEAKSLIEKNKDAIESKLRAFQQEIEDLKAKILGVAEIEKRLKKKLREMSGESGSNDLTRKLELKADIEDTKKEFSLTDEKIRSLAEIVDQFRREFETIEEFYI